MNRKIVARRGLRLLFSISLLHNSDPGAQDIGAPLLEHGGDDVDLLAIEDGA